MVNKKTLFLILLACVSLLPFVAAAAAGPQTIQGMAKSLQGNLVDLGIPLAAIGFIVVGIMYVSAAADPSKMSTAKQGLVAVVIGVVILILAGGALQFVTHLFGL